MTHAQTGVVELTHPEQGRLIACEATIERGLKTFTEVGKALITIRDERLYRATHATFEEYCEQRWQISRQRAYQLLDAAEVRQAILSTTVDEINSEPSVLPANEAQARPLTKLLPNPMAEPEVKAAAEQEIREVWAEAVQTAPRDTDGKPKVTARHVEETVARHTEPEPAPTSAPAAPADRKPNRRPITDAFRDASWDLIKVVERLERLALDDRYPRNAEQVSASCRADLLRAADLLAAVLDRVPSIQ